MPWAGCAVLIQGVSGVRGVEGSGCSEGSERGDFGGVLAADVVGEVDEVGLRILSQTIVLILIELTV